MHDWIGSHGIAHIDRALRREAAEIAKRFPLVDRETIEQRLRDTYDRLAVTATVQTHLVTIAGRIVVDGLMRGSVGAAAHAAG